MYISRAFAVLGLGFSLSLAACSGGDTTATDGAAVAPAADAPAASAASEAPATGNVIEVKMITEGNANYFEPAEVVAKPGDVVRFTLVSGLHNVSFPAGQNAAGASLPAASPFLQSPGQTFDVPVTMQPGTYTFQCDPHAMMGMVGTLVVQ